MRFSYSKSLVCVCVCGRVRARMYIQFLSCVQIFVTLWTEAHQPSLSVELSWCESWSRLPFPPPGDLPNPGNRTCISWVSCIAGGFFSSVPSGKSRSLYRIFISSMLVWCCGCGFFVFLFSWWLAVSALTNEKVKVTPSWPTLCKPMDCSLPGSSPSDSPGDNTGVKIKEKILEWVAFPFSAVSAGRFITTPPLGKCLRYLFHTSTWTQISRIAGGFFTIWATRETLY